jgi:hypothetical protein
MKKLLTLLGLTSLTMSGSLALVSYLTIPNAQANQTIVNPNKLAEASKYKFSSAELLNLTSAENNLDVPTLGSLMRSNFAELIDINTVLTVTELGEFSLPPDGNDILAQAKVMNSELDTTQLHVDSIEEGKATIEVNIDSPVYVQGTIDVTFAVKLIDLNEMFAEKDLGMFATQPDSTAVLERLQEIYPLFLIGEVGITIDTVDHQVTIEVNEDSTIYQQGTIDFSYSIIGENLRQLEDDVIERNLGEFAQQPEAQDILMQAFLLNMNFDMDQVNAIDITDTSAKLVVIPGSTVYAQGNIDVTFTVNQRVNLSSILKTTDLGIFPKEPTEAEILDRVVSLNGDVNPNEISIMNLSNGQAVVKVNEGSTVYNQEQINVSYTVDTRLILSEVLTTTDLGTFDDLLITEELILNHAVDKNPSLVTAELEVTSIDVAKGEAIITVKADSTVYQEGSVTVTYSVNQRIALDDIITFNNLGEFDSTPTSAQILDRLEQLNPGFVRSEVTVEDITDTSAKLVVNTDSTVYLEGELTVTYLVDQRAMLNEVIVETDLGLFLSKPTSDLILGRAKELNPNLDINELEVALLLTNQVVIRVKDNSTVYHVGSITLRYGIDNRIDLNEAILETDLGFFTAVPTNNQVLGRLKVLNQALNVNEITITKVENNQASVQVNAGSSVYKPMAMTLKFIVRVLTDFRLDVAVRDLGIFETEPTNDQVLDKLHDLNPNLNIDEIFVVLIRKNQVAIRVKDNSTVYLPGALALTFRVQPKLIGIEEVIKVTDLGEFMNQPTNQEILAKLRDLNPTLDINQV